MVTTHKGLMPLVLMLMATTLKDSMRKDLTLPELLNQAVGLMRMVMLQMEPRMTTWVTTFLDTTFKDLTLLDLT